MRGFEFALRQPSSMVHPSPGGVFCLGSTQFFIVFPSNRRIHPADFSSGVSTFVAAFTPMLDSSAAVKIQYLFTLIK